MIIMTNIIIKCPGKPARLIVFGRWDNRRRHRLAWRMRAMGFARGEIRRAGRFTEAGLAKLFGEGRQPEPPPKPSIWGEFADCLRAELARVRA